MTIRNITISRAATFDHGRPYCWIDIEYTDKPRETIPAPSGWIWAEAFKNAEKKKKELLENERKVR